MGWGALRAATLFKVKHFSFKVPLESTVTFHPLLKSIFQKSHL